MTKWVRVEDGLPDEQIYYEVLVVIDGRVTFAFYGKGIFTDPSMHHSDYGPEELANVTHWQPKPDPPTRNNSANDSEARGASMKQVDFCHVKGAATGFETGEAALFICPYCGPLNTEEKRRWHTPNANAWVINAISWAAEHWEKVDSANDNQSPA